MFDCAGLLALAEDQAQNWGIDLVEELKRARLACDVIIPQGGQDYPCERRTGPI